MRKRGPLHYAASWSSLRGLQVRGISMKRRICSLSCEAGEGRGGALGDFRVFPRLAESIGDSLFWLNVILNYRPGFGGRGGTARPYANDLRERVVALVLGGSTTRVAAARMQVSVASAVRWAQAARATGSAAAKPMGGKRPYLLAGQRDFLLGRLAEKPDLTLHALLAELRERGAACFLRHAVALPGQGETQLQKKRCSPPNRIGVMWRVTAPGGEKSSRGSIQNASSSSTRPGPKPT